MSRKIKYSKELKLEIVRRYLKGESTSLLANEYSLGGSTESGASRIRKWVCKYEQLGETAFDFLNYNNVYSKQLKETVVKEYLNGSTTYLELSNKYNISTDEIVRQWVLKYNQGIEIKDYNPKGDVYTMKSRKTTFEERIEIINYVLSHDNDYKGAADKYLVPYASVYQWVMKYKTVGEDGLKDNRGRPSTSKPKSETTIEELQAIKIQKLEKELERQKMINEVLKKNIEIQEQMERDSRRLYKKTNTKR